MSSGARRCVPNPTLSSRPRGARPGRASPRPPSPPTWPPPAPPSPRGSARWPRARGPGGSRRTGTGRRAGTVSGASGSVFGCSRVVRARAREVGGLAAKYASRSWLYLQAGPYEHSPLQKALHRNAPVEERACLRSSLARLRDVFSSGPGASAAAGRSSGARGRGRAEVLALHRAIAAGEELVRRRGVQGEPSGFTRAGAGASASGGHRAPDPAADRNRARAGSALGGGGGGMRAFERRSRSRVRGFGAEREGSRASRATRGARRARAE